MRELLARRASAQAGTLVPQRIARDTLATSYNLCGVVYASPAMHELVTLALHVASSHAPVLITGPNGSGKEKMADDHTGQFPTVVEALHQGQRRGTS